MTIKEKTNSAERLTKKSSRSDGRMDCRFWKGGLFIM